MKIKRYLLVAPKHHERLCWNKNSLPENGRNGDYQNVQEEKNDFKEIDNLIIDILSNFEIYLFMHFNFLKCQTPSSHKIQNERSNLSSQQGV